MLRRASLLALASVALLLPATASTLEEATVGVVAYQFDGATFHDAPDGCGEADAAWSLDVGGEADGLLVPPDDVRDAFVVDVPRSLVGHRVGLAVAEPTDAQRLTLDAYLPGCSGSILDAVNWPVPEPTPPAPAAGERQVSLGLAPDYCDSRQWAYVLGGMKGLPLPPSVYLAWTDATEHAVDLSWAHDGYAVYVTHDDLGVTLKGAWANVASAWAGDSWLVGPCDATDGGAVYGDSPTVDLGAIAFTPVRAGPHVVVVSWAGGALPPVQPPGSVDLDPTLVVEPHEAVEDPQGSADELVEFVMGPPPPQDLLPGIAVPASCHFCLPQVQSGTSQASYRLSAVAVAN